MSDVNLNPIFRNFYITNLAKPSALTPRISYQVPENKRAIFRYIQFYYAAFSGPLANAEIDIVVRVTRIGDQTRLYLRRNIESAYSDFVEFNCVLNQLDTLELCTQTYNTGGGGTVNIGISLYCEEFGIYIPGGR